MPKNLGIRRVFARLHVLRQLVEGGVGKAAHKAERSELFADGCGHA